MKANLKDILEAIPDYEELMKLSERIAELSFYKMQLENKLKGRESLIFQEAMKKPLENGKLPSASFVTNAYLHTGFKGELMEDREKLASTISELEKTKIQLSIYRDMMELFRTVSANERSSTSF